MRKKKFMAFVALIMIIIASMFAFYFINMNETHSVSLFTKHSLDRATKAAAMAVDDNILEDGVFKIDADKSIDAFADVISLNLGIETPFSFSAIKQMNGENYVYSYGGGEVNDELLRLSKTPKITYFVFNASGDRVTTDSAEVANFISEVRFALTDVQISNDSDDERAIKNAILTELTGMNVNSVSSGREPQIKDTRSFVLAVAEIPVNTFAGSLKKTYRFSTARLNSLIEKTIDQTEKVQYGLNGLYYEIAPGSIPAEKGKLVGQKIDKIIDFSWGDYEIFPGTKKDGVWVEWSGLVKSDYTGNVSFEVLADEGVKLNIDGVDIINQWDNQTVNKFSGTITMIKDKWYPVKLDFYESGGDAQVRFSWKYGSMIDYSLIPYVNLLPYGASYDGTKEFYGKSFTITEPIGVERKGEVIELPLVFDQTRSVKDLVNMTLLSGSDETSFTLEDVVRNAAGYITYANLIFVDDFSASESKSYNLVFSEGIYHFQPDAQIDIVADADYVKVKNDIYELQFKKRSTSGYSKAFIHGETIDLIGEKPDKNFFFSAINGAGYTDWAALSSHQIVKSNPVFKEVHYTINDADGLLRYNLKAKYYHGSSIVKHSVEVTNISTKALYSYMGGYAPKIATDAGNKKAWGVENNGSVDMTTYSPEAGRYLATGTSFSDTIGLHSLNGVANVDADGIMLSHDGEQQIIRPGESSTEKSFWLTIGYENENYTLRLLNQMSISGEDQFNILEKPVKPIILASNTNIVNPFNPITFSISGTVDQNGRRIVDTQWEGLSSSNIYPGGAHTVKARVQNELGIWSDWAEYSFVVKINVLEIYPVGEQLRNALNSIGHNGINVEAISIDNFNNNRPNIDNYDVILFGFGDRYRTRDISDFMADKVQKFIAAGGGVVFTHDTMETSSKNFYTYFGNYLKLTPGGTSWSASSIKSNGGLKILKFPYTIPTNFSVQSTSWQPFSTGANVSAFVGTNPEQSWHLITNRNVAYLNSGQNVYNSSGGLIQNLSSAPINERYLIVNTIFAVSSYKASISEPVAKVQTDKSSYKRGDSMLLFPVSESYPNGRAVSYMWQVEELHGLKRIFNYSTKTVDFLIPVTSGVLPSYKIRLQVTDQLGIKSQWSEIQVNAFNIAPTVQTFTHTAVKEGALYKVTFNVIDSDPEGDTRNLQWENRQTYYPSGKHTVRVRSVDSLGGVSTWKTIELDLE